MQSRTGLAVAVAILLVVGAVPFGVSTSDAGRPESVPFGDVETVGLPGSATLLAHGNVVIPRAEAFYSQFRYVVGYNGITPLLSQLRTGDSRTLGRLTTAYVSTFSKTEVSLTEEGFLRIPEARATGWIPAEEAYFVVDSQARVPTQNSTVVPFSNHADARAFVEQYGGHVVRWSELRRLPFDPLGHTQREWNRIVERRDSRTDQTVRDVRSLLNRPMSVVVGQDAPTLTAAVEQAPPNTTVRVPPGTYSVANLSVRKPITIRGAGQNATHLVGDENGSVVRAFASRTAIADLSVSGVGPRRSGKNRTNLDIPVNRSNPQYTYRKVHGYGDAGIVFDTAPRSLVSHVRINTTSNGVIARESPNAVVSNLTVYGAKNYREGFLAVSAVGAGIVVQDSHLYGGKVGVYGYAVSNLVVRRTEMEGMMLGVLDLFSRRNYLANNTVSDVLFGIQMERKTYESVVVGNEIRDASMGLYVGGTANYVGNNTLVQNTAGVKVNGFHSTFANNVIAYNEIGARSTALLSTNRVTDNDFVYNEIHARTSSFNTLHLWRGNYWSGAPGVDFEGDGRLDRAFRPTSRIDRLAREGLSGRTLARSPALQSLRYLQRFLPGLRGDAVVDPAPLAIPVRQRRVSRLRNSINQTGQVDDSNEWDYG